MKHLALLSLCFLIGGCGLLAKEKPEPLVAPSTAEPPPQPVGYAQSLSQREPYTGHLPYVLCFGADCDRPTPKTIARPAPAVQPVRLPVAMPAAPATKETRIKESIAFLFNTTKVDPESAATLTKLVGAARDAREIWIKGFAGLTDTNLEKESAVMGLALARAHHIQRHMKGAGVAAHITAGAELVRCKSEADCLERFKFGGRRADLEIVIVSGGKTGVEQDK